jgi:cytochrome c-type biogenesis protein CcmH
MRRRWAALLLAVLLAIAGIGTARAVDPTQLPNPQLQARYLALTHEFRCMQCQNESLADSPVELAADMRAEVRDMLLAGKSDDQIRAFMVARYGDFILFRPRFNARTGWVWLAPGVLLLVGAWVCVRVLRQRAALLPTDTDSVEEDVRT